MHPPFIDQETETQRGEVTLRALEAGQRQSRDLNLDRACWRRGCSPEAAWLALLPVQPSFWASGFPACQPEWEGQGRRVGRWPVSSYLGSLETGSQKVINKGVQTEASGCHVCTLGHTGMCTHMCGLPTPAGAHTCSVVASTDTCEHTDAITGGRRWGPRQAWTHLRTPMHVSVMSKVESGKRSNLGSFLVLTLSSATYNKPLWSTVVCQALRGHVTGQDTPRPGLTGLTFQGAERL